MIIGREFIEDLPENPSVDVFDKTFQEKRELKLLGIFIDNKLTFENHVNKLVEKCTRNIRFLWRTSKNRTSHQKLLLGNALVMTHLNYCELVYHNFISRKLINLIESIQYKLMKFIVGVMPGQLISRETLHNHLNWTSLENKRKINFMSVFLRIFNDESFPKYFIERINLNEGRTRQLARNSTILTSIARKTVNNVYCSLYQKLPRYITDMPNLASFKRAIKLFLLT